MAWTEEVFKNDGKWRGANTGHEYSASEVEQKGLGTWVKPCYAAPDALVMEIECGDQEAPEGNGCGKR